MKTLTILIILCLFNIAGIAQGQEEAKANKCQQYIETIAQRQSI